MFDCISVQANQIITELISLSKLKAGDIIVVGCSSSEVAGHKIGTDSSPDIAKTIVNAILPIIRENNLFLAAQCCEHLNRAIIIEHDAAVKYNLTEVNVIPQPKAGGSFATAAYNAFENPVAVESLCHKAAAGIDIGGTLIGMHLREVAVPLRLSVKTLGEATLLAARTRPKFVGGSRAVYNEDLL